MATFIEYELEDGGTILVEMPEKESGGIVKASRDADGNVVIKAGQKFGDALDGVVAQAKVLKARLEALRAEEVEVTFGLKTTGKLGNFAVGEVGVEANYAVKLKWSNPSQSQAEKKVEELRTRAARQKRIRA